MFSEIKCCWSVLPKGKKLQNVELSRKVHQNKRMEFHIWKSSNTGFGSRLKSLWFINSSAKPRLNFFVCVCVCYTKLSSNWTIINAIVTKMCKAPGQQSSWPLDTNKTFIHEYLWQKTPFIYIIWISIYLT